MQELAQELWCEIVQDSLALGFLTTCAVVHDLLVALQLQRGLHDVVFMLQQVASL